MANRPFIEGDDDADRTRVSPDAVAARFRAAWRRGERPRIESYLAAVAPPQYRAVLAALIKADMAERFAANDRVDAEDYAARIPQIREDETLLRELLAEQSILRRRQAGAWDAGACDLPLRETAGEPALWIEPQEPGAAPSAALSHVAEPCDEPSSLPLGLPAAVEHGPEHAGRLPDGSMIGDFEIIRPLGEGAIAQVYLARQQSLGRLVALKVSPNAGDEGRTLASLEHDHIVQVFAEQVVGAQRLMAMRYVPGVTLARVLELLSRRNRAELTGQDLVAAVDQAIGQAAGSQDSAARHERLGLPWLSVCCRLIAELARALEHAHGHAILHRDIKPANILVAQSGRALLMDFNVATRRDARDTTIAGTPAYMAPEHLAAMALLDTAQFGAVDERSDVFSLGVVLFELITGRHPYRRGAGSCDAAGLRQMIGDRLQGPPSVRSAGLEVSPGVESIVAKCLAAQPGARYQRAAELAEDLERHISDRPLEYARDSDPRERAGKWLRRHRSFKVAAYAVAAAVALIAIGLAMADWRRLSGATELLERAEAQLIADSPHHAAALLADAGPLIAASLSASRILGSETTRAELAQRAEQLSHDVTLALIELFASSRDAVRAAGMPLGQSHASEYSLSLFRVLQHDDWQRRPPFTLFEPADQDQIEQDVTELLVVSAIDLLASNSREPGRTRHELVSDQLRRVPARFSKLRIVQELSDAIRTGADALAASPSDPPQDWTELDLYLCGVKEAKHARDRTARLYFKAAAARCVDADQPLKFWSHFQQADCAYRLGLLSEAAKEYGTCIGLRGELAWPYYNLGLVFWRDEKLEEAVEQFEQAIARDPSLAAAYGNLAAVLCQLRRFDAAERICSRAIQIGHSTPELYCNRGTARAVLGDRDGAIADFQMALRARPDLQEARDNLMRLGDHPGATRP